MTSKPVRKERKELALGLKKVNKSNNVLKEYNKSRSKENNKSFVNYVVDVRREKEGKKRK